MSVACLGKYPYCYISNLLVLIRIVDTAADWLRFWLCLMIAYLFRFRVCSESADWFRFLICLESADWFVLWILFRYCLLVQSLNLFRNCKIVFMRIFFQNPGSFQNSAALHEGNIKYYILVGGSSGQLVHLYDANYWRGGYR